MPIKGTYYNATLGAAPTTSAHLGGITGGTLITSSIGANSPTSILSITLSVGAWILLGNTRFGSVSYSSLSISSTNNTEDFNTATVVQGNGGMTLQVSRYIMITSGTQPWYLVATSGGAQTVTNHIFTAVRVG